jgi:hypothetical protein
VKPFNFDNHAFIVRIWPEPREIEGAAPQWRGKIENAANPREQRSLKDLDEIISFITPYLQKMGVEVSRPRKWREYFTRRLPFSLKK